MKKVIITALLAFGLALSASAQNNIFYSTFGVVTDASGIQSIIDPSTTIAVDITVKKEQNIIGPYARYAQKYLDVRGSLVEKTTYSIEKAKVAVVCDAQIFAEEIEAGTTQILSHNGNDSEFAKILPDRMTNTSQSLDAAAMDAAAMIFTIRRQRMELISGEAGENVFGGGLKDALEALDKQEQALLELFFGKNIITTSTERFYINVKADAKSYVLTHFSKNNGLGESGDAITLNITPSGESKLSNITEADAKEKSFIKVRVADMSTCEVKVGDNVVATYVKAIPIFEFGRTIKVSVPATK